MTDPIERTLGVDSIMELVRTYRKSIAAFYLNKQPLINMENDGKALEQAIRALVDERDRWKQHHKELVNDFLPDNECLPACDSYGHADECPVYNAQAASRKLIADRATLVSQRDAAMRENKELREAVLNHSLMCFDRSTYQCAMCGAVINWCTTEEKAKAEICHEPVCIIHRLSSGEVSK